MDLTPISGILKGSFTSAGAGFNLPLGFVPTYYHAINLTQASSSANPGVVKKVEWFQGMAADSLLVTKNTNSAATDESSLVTTGGITAYDSATPATYAPVAITSISQANPALVTSATHGLVDGNLVRIYGVATMTQLNGLVFTVDVQSGTTFTIPVNTSGFAAGGTGGFLQRVSSGLFSPYRNEIVAITQAANAVVSTAKAHGYVAGDFVKLYVPSQWGMTQANLKQVKILSVTSLTFTCDLDTTAFTAFAFPLAAAFPLTYAQVVPVGEVALSLLDPMRNVGTTGLSLGLNAVGAASDVWYWFAILGSAPATA